MKNSTAFRQAKGSVRFLSVVVPVMFGLYFWFRVWPLLAIAAFMSLYLLGDIWIIVKTRRSLKTDPEFLKKEVPGT